MRIAVCGTQCVGKTTFINDFIEKWPMYKKPDKTYRDIIAEKNIKLNKDGNRDSQFAVLDALCEQASENSSEEFCIHDRCIIDNVAYTMWLAMNEKGGVLPSDVTASIIQSRIALSHYDVIFFLPLSNMSKIPLEERENRDIDEGYRNEIDSILKAFAVDYTQKKGNFFPLEDCPALIEIFGNRMERIQLASLYIKDDGRAFGDEDGTLLTMETNPEELSLFEKDRILQQLSE